TIFLSSHMLGEVQQLCQRVAVLKAGRVIAQGRVADLLSSSRSIVIGVAGDPEPAVALLQALPWVTAVRREAALLLVDAPIERAAEINHLLVTQGVAVAEIHRRELTLEEFFLNITDESATP